MKTHVIIGAAAAGIGVLNTLVKLDPNSRIICISDEPENPYNKCFLADYLHKIKEEGELGIVRSELVNNSNVHLFLGTRVTNINPEAKTISLHDGTTVHYDTLFIGTGSSPVMPPISGLRDGGGVFTFHTLADANKIKAYAKDYGVKDVAIIGAGLSGLECADSLRSWGLGVTVIERSARVLGRQVDEEGSQFIANMMQQMGIELLCEQTVSEVVHENGRVAGVRFQNGVERRPEMVIIATGLKPNVELARDAGLVLRDGYILVDEYMNASDPSIFAGGDCVMVLDQITQHMVPSCTWPDAMAQGSIAAHNMTQAQIKKSYPGAFVITSSAFFGKTFVTCGLVNDIPSEFEVRITRGDDFYHKLVLDQGILKGYLLIGNTAQASRLRRAILTRDPGFTYPGLPTRQATPGKYSDL